MKKIIILQENQKLIAHVTDTKEKLPELDGLVATFNVSNCYIVC